MNNFPASVGVVNVGVACVLSVMFPAVSNHAITILLSPIKHKQTNKRDAHTLS